MVVKVVNIDVSKKLNQLPRRLQPCHIGCQKVAALSKNMPKSYRLVKKKLPKSCSLVKVVAKKLQTCHAGYQNITDLSAWLTASFQRSLRGLLTSLLTSVRSRRQRRTSSKIC